MNWFTLFFYMSVFSPVLSPHVGNWFSSHGYASLSLIAKGKSGAIWKLEKEGSFFAAKVEHSHSTRKAMIEKEVRLLRMANEAGVGPKIMEVDLDAGIVVMSFVDGMPLASFIDACVSRVKMERVLTRLFLQARRLDRVGIDHGQLGGKLHNILIDTSDQPVILDFEKASYVRNVHNVSKLKEVLLGGRNPFSIKILSCWPNVRDELDF
ncbi:MAG: RIO1 family regulatory kinase/ATPase [Candidatus Diapherotrites archaeon]